MLGLPTAHVHSGRADARQPLQRLEPSRDPISAAPTPATTRSTCRPGLVPNATHGRRDGVYCAPGLCRFVTATSAPSTNREHYGQREGFWPVIRWSQLCCNGHQRRGRLARYRPQHRTTQFRPDPATLAAFSLRAGGGERRCDRCEHGCNHASEAMVPVHPRFTPTLTRIHRGGPQRRSLHHRQHHFHWQRLRHKYRTPVSVAGDIGLAHLAFPSAGICRSRSIELAAKQKRSAFA